MIEADYKHLVHELCAQVQLQDWESVAQDRHFEIDGVVTGLLHDEFVAPDTLTICFEFGQQRDPLVHKLLLEHNLTAPPATGARGSFGVIPEQGNVAYRVDMSWPQSLTGAELLQQIGHHLRTAQEALHDCGGV